PLQSLALMELSLSVAMRRADLARKLASHNIRIVPVANGYSIVASNTIAGVRLFRSLLRKIIRKHTPTEALLNHFLAARIGTVGLRLSHLGRREEALAANQEAVDIQRRLAQTRPDVFLPYLAISLINLCTDPPARRRWPRTRRPSTSIGASRKRTPTT